MSILGRFITNNSCSPFLARRIIEVKKPLERATVKVCGLGQFVLHINGKKVGDHELDPGWTDYHKVIEYVTFDVTDMLLEGKNVLGVEVGNGWYIKNDEHYTFSFPEFMPKNPNPYRPFGKSLVLACNLSLHYTDGTQEEICADENFKVAKHPIVQSNVYGSETVDFSLLERGWNTVEFSDSHWECAALVPLDEEPEGQMIEQFQPPIKVIKSYEGKYLHTVFPKKKSTEKEQPSGQCREIYDFGQNMSGILSLSVKGKKGDEIRIYPAEKLNEEKDVDQMMKGWCLLNTVVIIRIGQDDVWEDYRQKFTYFAGRYVAVEKTNAASEIKDLTGNAITSAWKKSGTFVCDDKRYNQIYEMIEKTVEANMLSVHTDCPTIERFAWQEPNHLMAPSIMFMKDGEKLWKKFLLDMRMAQHKKGDSFFDYDGNRIEAGDGLVPSQAPCYIPNVIPVPGMGSFYDIIPWGSSAILGARWHYRFYGDSSVLEENYEMGMRYFQYLKTKRTVEGFISHGLGDWGNPDNELARENIETAFLYADAKALAEAAGILGRENDKEGFLKDAREIQKNYNEKLLVKVDGKFLYKSFEHKGEIIKTQAVEALPLYFGLVPKEAEADVVDAFRETLEEKKCFSSGEVGLPYIIQTASKYGMNELIADYIMREEHPSYYAFVKDGMTTLGEYWEKNPRSHCHDMMGHIIEWYFTGIAGIEPLEPGFRKIRIHPWMPESVNTFTCSYDTPYGTIVVRGERINQIPKFEITLPDMIEIV